MQLRRPLDHEVELGFDDRLVPDVVLAADVLLGQVDAQLQVNGSTGVWRTVKLNP